MVVVIHQDPGVAQHPVLLYHFGQGLEEALPVFIIPHDSLTRVASRRDMIDCAGIGYAQRPGHNGVVLEPMCKVKT